MPTHDTQVQRLNQEHEDARRALAADSRRYHTLRFITSVLFFLVVRLQISVLLDDMIKEMRVGHSNGVLLLG